MYNLEFRNSYMGYATAVGIAIFIIGIALSLTAEKLSRKDAIEFRIWMDVTLYLHLVNGESLLFQAGSLVNRGPKVYFFFIP